VSAHSDFRAAREFPILCYVTDRRSLLGDVSVDGRVALAAKIATLASAGINWVQIREKDLSAKEIAAIARQALQSARAGSNANRTPVRILVNDRLDVALAAGTGGVHLGENSLPAQEVKRFSAARRQDNDFLIGVSCHSLESAKSAASDGADYLFFGPVFATPAKTAFGTPQGLERLAQVCHAVSLPVLAIGGITLENAGECLTAGAAGISAIRLFQDSADPAATIRALRKLAE
jgi:thiamine-phosphate pyrophosphorylase